MRGRFALGLLGVTLACLIWSVIRPADLPTWALEVFPAVAAMVLLGATYRRFPLTPLLYALIAFHAVVLIVGGHYTYAKVPIGNWVKDWLDLERNHYDRFAHFVQGVVPAIAAREVLLRTSTLVRGWWLVFLVLCVCLAVSALYEIVEWGSAVFLGSGSTEFLGTQGDEWDAQKDMALCLLGAAASLAAFSRWHNAQLARWCGLPDDSGARARPGG